MSESPVQEAGEFQLSLRKWCGEQRTLRNDDHIDGVRPDGAAEELTDAALGQVAFHRRPDFPARRHAEPPRTLGAGADHQGHQRPMTLDSGVEHR
jgi:hypothetical protein